MMTEEGLEVVNLRNNFYRDNYRKIVIGLMMSFFIIFLLVAALAYIILNPPSPKYFATSTQGRIIPLVALDQPNLSNAALLQWATTATVDAYSYNFVNYRNALEKVSDNFTKNGWSNFIQALKSSNNLTAVTEKKLVVSAVPTGAPVILIQGILAGEYAWKVQMPLLITYQSASQFSQQSVLVTLLIVRISTLDSPNGVGIAQFIVSGSGDDKG